MSRAWRLGGVVGLVALVAAGTAPAQESFDELFAAAQAVDAEAGEARRAAFVTAYVAFSKLAPGSAAYQGALPRGAVAALEGRRYGAAVDLLAERWTVEGGSASLLGLRLRALVGAGRAAAAIALARRHEAAWPPAVDGFFADRGNFGALMAAGDLSLLSRNTGLGVWVFVRLAQAYPRNAGVLANLALTYRRLGRLESADQTYQSALVHGASLDWLWTDYGLLYKGQGLADAAAERFRTALACEKVAGDSPAGTNLAVLAIRTGADRGRDPEKDVLAVVRRRADAAMARRLFLDLLARKRK